MSERGADDRCGGRCPICPLVAVFSRPAVHLSGKTGRRLASLSSAVAAALFAIGAGLSHAQGAPVSPSVAVPETEAQALLGRIQDAASKLDYSGIFTYQQGETIQSSHVVRVVDGSGERERIEVLDGQPREYLRHNDDIQCLVPEHKTISGPAQACRAVSRPAAGIADGAHQILSGAHAARAAPGRRSRMPHHHHRAPGQGPLRLPAVHRHRKRSAAEGADAVQFFHGRRTGRLYGLAPGFDGGPRPVGVALEYQGLEGSAGHP